MKYLGMILRKHREQTDRSLYWLSEQLGKSVSFLAAVERNEKQLPYDLFLAWCRAIWLPLSQDLVRAWIASRSGVTIEMKEKEGWKRDLLAAFLMAWPDLKESDGQQLRSMLLGSK